MARCVSEKNHNNKTCQRIGFRTKLQCYRNRIIILPAVF